MSENIAMMDVMGESSSKDAEIKLAVRKILECPICNNAMETPIYQCGNGHLLCSTCQSKCGDKCPFCRDTSLPHIRCKAMEMLAQKLSEETILAQIDTLRIDDLQKPAIDALNNLDILYHGWQQEVKKAEKLLDEKNTLVEVNKKLQKELGEVTLQKHMLDLQAFNAETTLMDLKIMLAEELKKFESRGHIGTKIAGQLDEKLFLKALKVKDDDEEALKHEAQQKCAYWQMRVYDQNWHPLHVSASETTPDEADEELQKLRRELGEEAYQLVVKALLDLEHYNGLAWTPFLVLWNFRDAKEATVQEGVEAIFSLLDEKASLRA